MTAPYSRRPVSLAILLGPALLLAPTVAGAQELEPKAYTNLPVGLNFLVAAYAHSSGGLSTDPSLPIEDARLKIHTGVLAYARGLDMWGSSGKIDMIVPYSRLSGTALVAGRPLEREVSGFGDPRLRVSVNFYGAPALSLKDYAAFEQDLVIGASLQVTVPAGQYDASRAVNLGSNRWSIKPDVGFSQALGSFIVDMTAGVTLFSSNEDFFGSQKLEQAPIHSLQTNLSYTFSGGIWASLGATYYAGGRTTVNGVRKDTALNNSRAGLTVSVPIDRYTSIKFNISSGIITRTGSNFDTGGLALQHHGAQASSECPSAAYWSLDAIKAAQIRLPARQGAAASTYCCTNSRTPEGMTK